MNKEASAKSPPQTIDRATTAHPPKIFVVCDQQAAAPVWGNLLGQEGLTVTSIEKIGGHWFTGTSDLAVIDWEPFYQK